MNFELLLYECQDGIAVITINRPRALNALNVALLEELDQAFTAVAAAAEVRCVILTGAGKGFVAGADIAGMLPLDALGAKEFSRLGHRLLERIESLPQPVIAAIHGFALGGGCELAMACDIRIAAEQAKFGQPEVNLGVMPGFGGTQRLPRLVGKGIALELILTGDIIDAAEACRIGLVNKVVAGEELLATARAMAAKIASKGPLAVRLSKEAVGNGMELDLARANRYEAEVFALCFASADQKEGMQAFLDKRPARFQGR